MKTIATQALRRAAVVAALLATAAIDARAAAITVNNHSFENPVTPPDSFIANVAPTGWSVFGSIDFGARAIGVLNPNTTLLYLDPVPHGANVGVTFLLDPGAAVPSGLQQTLGATLQTNTTYTLTVEVGNLAFVPTPPHNAFNFTGFPGYRVDLLAGGVVIASDNNTLLPGEGRFLTSTVQLSVGATHAQAGQLLGIRLVNLDGPNGIEVNFDDVRLDATPIPEPAAATLGAAGFALGLALWRRRANRAATRAQGLRS